MADSIFNLIKARRSIRAYGKKHIPIRDIELCAEAARYAPSACNSQPWKFIIVTEPSIKKKISEKAFSGIFKMNSFAKYADAYIIVISDTLKFPAWLGGKLRGTDFRKIDTGIACSHIILQAQELGIGTCVLGWFNERVIKRSLHVPLNKKVELIIALGYTDQGSFMKGKNLKDKKQTIFSNTYDPL
ncbi:MAG: nitroreductase family protein [Candidatus Omnitrophota bacterium]